MDATMGTIRIRSWVTSFLPVLAGILWLLAIGFGLTKLFNYEYQAGPEGRLSLQWPTASMINPQKDVFRFVMVLHPHCPCSRATLNELEILMSHNLGRVRAYLLFVRPKQFDNAWVETDLYRHALRIPGVKVIIDDEGKEAQLFGATTSGESFLYDKGGKLVFSGGITESRGHEGDNTGLNSVDALINGRPVKIHKTKFFGCCVMKSLRR